MGVELDVGRVGIEGIIEKEYDVAPEQSTRIFIVVPVLVTFLIIGVLGNVIIFNTLDGVVPAGLLAFALIAYVVPGVSIFINTLLLLFMAGSTTVSFRLKEILLAFNPPDHNNRTDLSVIFKEDNTGAVGGGGNVLNVKILHVVEPEELIA